MTAVTETLARFAASIAYENLPDAVAERARLLIMDQFGIALRARNEAELTASALAAVQQLGMGAGNATVLGEANGYAPSAAAFLNGTFGHSLDFDDTHAAGSIHPSAPIVPAALAAAEMCGASGRDTVAAIVAGYEIQIRLSLALNPTEHYKQGFHPTATCGVFGAAAAAGRVFGLSAEQIAHALGLAGSQAAGSMQFLTDGAWNKAFHVGHAAASGLSAATFARNGFRGAAGAIEGEAGFLHGYAPNADPAKAIADLNQHWETLDIAVKPYPSCRYGHAAMDALIELRAANDLDVDGIESIEIGLPATGMRIIGDPVSEKQSPKNYVDGQFSMPFVAAVALREGGMSWDSYAQHLNDPKTLELCRRIVPVNDPLVEAEFPAHMSGSARVRTSAGELEKLVVAAKGEPENFLSADEFRAKFDGLVSPYMDEAAREQAADALLNLHEKQDVASVLALSRPSAQPQLRAAGGSGDD